ncbi:MAG: sulfur relay protein DsrC [Pseudomonadota bacterium]
MIHLSEILIQEHDLVCFKDLEDALRSRAVGELHLALDVKPQFADTPVDWEARLESVFSGRS